MKTKVKTQRQSMEKEKSEATTMRVGTELNKNFRRVCAILGVDPKQQHEKILKNWTESTIKGMGKQRVEELFV